MKDYTRYIERLIELVDHINSTQGQVREGWIQHLIGYIEGIREVKQ